MNKLYMTSGKAAHSQLDRGRMNWYVCIVHSLTEDKGTFILLLNGLFQNRLIQALLEESKAVPVI